MKHVCVGCVWMRNHEGEVKKSGMADTRGLCNLKDPTYVDPSESDQVMLVLVVEELLLVCGCARVRGGYLLGD